MNKTWILFFSEICPKKHDFQQALFNAIIDAMSKFINIFMTENDFHKFDKMKLSTLFLFPTEVS